MGFLSFSESRSRLIDQRAARDAAVDPQFRRRCRTQRTERLGLLRKDRHEDVRHERAAGDVARSASELQLSERGRQVSLQRGARKPSTPNKPPSRCPARSRPCRSSAARVKRTAVRIDTTVTIQWRYSSNGRIETRVAEGRAQRYQPHRFVARDRREHQGRHIRSNSRIPLVPDRARRSRRHVRGAPRRQDREHAQVQRRPALRNARAGGRARRHRVHQPPPSRPAQPRPGITATVRAAGCAQPRRSERRDRDAVERRAAASGEPDPAAKADERRRAHRDLDRRRAGRGVRPRPWRSSSCARCGITGAGRDVRAHPIADRRSQPPDPHARREEVTVTGLKPGTRCRSARLSGSSSSPTCWPTGKPSGDSRGWSCSSTVRCRANARASA